MIAEIVQRLNEVLGQSEILLQHEIIRILEDMRHLKGDGLDEPLGVFSEVSILRR